jgi:hypothetical protein
MSKPVVVDDGGSLRIRQLEDQVGMPGLLPPPPLTDKAPQPFNGGPRGSFRCRLTVRYFVGDGSHHVLPDENGKLLLLDDTVIIDADDGSGQMAIITFDKNTFRMIITLTGNGNPPDTSEETDVNGNLRYIVSNADTVQSVTVRHSAGPDDVYTPGGSILTMVHFHHK